MSQAHVPPQNPEAVSKRLRNADMHHQEQKVTSHSKKDKAQSRQDGRGRRRGRKERDVGRSSYKSRTKWVGGKRRRKRINPFCTYSESLWVIQRMLHPQKPPTSVTF